MTIDRRRFLLSAGACLAATRVFAQQPLPHGSTGVTIYARPRDYSADLPRHLTRLMDERREQRRRAVAAVTTRAQAEQRIRDIRAKVWELMGGPLEKTPLNPRIAGAIDREGYRIHRLVYESRPRLYVTSNLYVPAGRGPFPAVLSPLGHSANGKAYALYQALFHTLARKGYVVLAFDPFGQGERIEYPAAPGRSSLGSPTTEHDYAGKRLLLLGCNFSLYRAWDGIRGIDYLLTRDDVDPNRIGCGGQSGGGTMTMFLAAVDERIKAAVVSEGNTENVAQPNFEPPGAVDDAEQNLVASLVYGLDRFDLLHAVAPRPLLITFSNKDAGTTYGPEFAADTLRAYEELRKTYRLLGAEDRVKAAETPMVHGYTYEHRRASYAWYNKWLGNTAQDDAETPVAPEPDEKLWYTKTGLVSELGGESSFTLTRKLAAQTAPAQPVTVAVIREVLGLASGGAAASGRAATSDRTAASGGAAASGRAATEVRRGGREGAVPGTRAGEAAPAPRTCSLTEKYDHVIEEIDVPVEDEIHVPGWVVRGKTTAGRRPAVLVLPSGQKESSLGDDGAGAAMARAGYVFCAFDVRGRGQCTPHPPQRGPRYYSGRGEDYYVWDTLMLGRPMLGMHVRDALAALAYLRSRADVDASRCWIIGQGTMGVVALLALALEPAACGGIAQGAITGYRSIVENDRYNTPFRIFALNLLRRFDLPDIAALVAPRPLLLLGPLLQDGSEALRGGIERVAAMYPRATVRPAERDATRAWLQWLDEKSQPG